MHVSSKQIARIAAGLLTVFICSTPAAAQGPQGTIEYYHVDAIGSVRAVTNQQGAVVRRHNYLAFGEEYLSDQGADSRRFTGKERDAETGLDYFGARYYSQRLGRWGSVDPSLNIGKSLVDPQLWNRYAYVTNNPLRYIDPDGRERAQILLDQDVRDLLAGKISREEYLDRLRARGAGAAVGAAAVAGGIGGARLASLALTASGLLGSGPGSVVLGESMRRVNDVAAHLKAGTFTAQSAKRAAWMSENMAWLQRQITRGSRIFDIGIDVQRKDGGSAFYKAELELLNRAGFIRKLVGLVDVEGKLYRLYEWVPASPK